MISEDLIFIIGIHKSGTSYLRALLDSHPDLSVLPFETHPFEIIGKQTKYPLRKNSLVYKEYFKQAIEGLKDYKSNYGENVNVELNKSLLDLINWNLEDREFLIDYWEKLLDYFGMPKDNYIVEKSVENVFYVKELLQWFPHAKFIHITRPFFEHNISLRKYFKPKFYSKRNYRYPYLIWKSKALAKANSEKYKLLKNYYHIELDKLRSNTWLELAKLLEFLRIPYHENVLQATTLGFKWKSNTQEREK